MRVRIKLNDFFSSQQAFVTRSWVINTKDQLSTTSWEDYVQWNISIWHTTSYKTSAHTHFQGQTSLSLCNVKMCSLSLCLNSIHKGFFMGKSYKVAYKRLFVLVLYCFLIYHYLNMISEWMIKIRLA